MPLSASRLENSPSLGFQEHYEEIKLPHFFQFPLFGLSECSAVVFVQQFATPITVIFGRAERDNFLWSRPACKECNNFAPVSRSARAVLLQAPLNNLR